MQCIYVYFVNLFPQLLNAFVCLLKLVPLYSRSQSLLTGSSRGLAPVPGPHVSSSPEHPRGGPPDPVFPHTRLQDLRCWDPPALGVPDLRPLNPSFPKPGLYEAPSGPRSAPPPRPGALPP